MTSVQGKGISVVIGRLSHQLLMYSVFVKHQGKRYEVEIDPTSTGETFKYQLYSLTGVEPDRQKILVKGGQLKDETELSKLGAKPGQTFMMMGTSSTGRGADGLERPKEVLKFVEDMTDAEAAKAEGAIPAGLQNLGNTCYLNSTLQTLRSIPELQEALSTYIPTPAPHSASSFAGSLVSVDMISSLKDLYKQMGETQNGIPPSAFLYALQAIFPQFAQKSKSGQGYAQQDAEEAWSQIVSQLRQKLKLKYTRAVGSQTSNQENTDVSFIDNYLAGRFDITTECDEVAAKEAGEEAILSQDLFFKLDCHINKDTNHLRDGILAGFEEKIEKKSPKLDRDAIYTKKSRISRLPKYLTVHFVRFFWKREVQKKSKIMRKVTFPPELDVVEFCTESLREKLVPVRDKVREVRKDEEDVIRARKRQKLAHKQEEDRLSDLKASGASETKGTENKKTEIQPAQDHKIDGKSEDAEMTDVIYKTDAEYDAERIASIYAARKELFALIHPELRADEGANQSGLYELRGVVTHQGASADSGHYTSYVKKQGALDPVTGKRKEEDGKWWWFNDDKVFEVDADKIATLSGGGT